MNRGPVPPGNMVDYLQKAAKWMRGHDEYELMERDFEAIASHLKALESEVERLTEWNENAQSLNGLLEMEVERLREALQDVVDHMIARTDDEGRAYDKVLAALEGEQDG